MALLLFHFLFTHVHTRTYAVAVVRVLKARIAETVVGAYGVLAGPVSTGLSLTLVHVWNQRAASQFYHLAEEHRWDWWEVAQLTDTHRQVPSCFEAIGADAAIAPQCVNAMAWIAYAGVLVALVTVWDKREKQMSHFESIFK